MLLFTCDGNFSLLACFFTALADETWVRVALGVFEPNRGKTPEPTITGGSSQVEVDLVDEYLESVVTVDFGVRYPKIQNRVS